MTLKPRFKFPNEYSLARNSCLVAHLKWADFYADPTITEEDPLDFKFAIITEYHQYFFDRTSGTQYHAAIKDISDEDREVVRAIIATLGEVE